MPTLNKRNILIFLAIVLIIALPLIAYKYNAILGLLGLGAKPVAVVSTKMACPSSPIFCAKGVNVFFDNKYYGFGGTLTPGDPVYAAFDGNVTTVNTIMPPALDSEKLNTIYLDNKEKGVRAVYYFKGQTFVAPKVKKGDLMGTTQEKMNSFNTWLVFQVINGDPITGSKPILTSKDFEN